MIEERIKKHIDINEAYKDVALTVIPNKGLKPIRTFRQEMYDSENNKFYLDSRIIERLELLKYQKFTLSQELTIP